MVTSVLTSKGQLLIPSRLRKKYGMDAGKKIAFLETKDGIVLKPVDENFINQFVGMFKDVLPSTGAYITIKKEEMELEAEKEERIFKAKKQ